MCDHFKSKGPAPEGAKLPTPMNEVLTRLGMEQYIKKE
jgi:hypothetical protein